MHYLDPAALCAELIRFDTTNHGGGLSTGEAAIAEFIANKLRAAGYNPAILGPSPDRASVIVRVEGTEPELAGVLVHAHTDVVPAEPEQWTDDPFSGNISDGYIYGRGAVDMKDMVAMTLSTLLEWADAGTRPRRTITILFVADEEDRGDYGAQWLVSEHPELFEGVAMAIGESGAVGELVAPPASAAPNTGKANTGKPIRLYPIAAGERGTMQIRLTANGTSGHGSRPNPDNAVVHLIKALHRIVEYRWPITLIPSVRSYIELTTKALGLAVDLDSEEGIYAAVKAMGSAGEVAGATIRVTSTPTVLEAGYKVNVVPGVAHASIDIRVLPGTEHDVRAIVMELVGPLVSIEYISDQAPVQSPIDSPWYEAMRSSVIAFDPEAVVVPFCMGGGTDAKAFHRLGIATYGFAPLGIDPDGRRPSGMHGVDERVPVSSIREGQRMLDHFLRTV